MRFMTSLVITSFAMCSLTGAPAFAKSSKYQRPTSTDDSNSANAAPGASPAPNGTPQGLPSAAGDKKVDLTDLENRYWTAKDTEFNVVQNRLYTKAKRFSVNPMIGVDLTDQYNTAYNFGVSANYYFSEREGVGIDFWTTTATPNSTVTYFSNRFGVQPDYNIPTGYVGANYNWIPIYAKLSLLEKKIIYFDLSISPGIGLTSMHSNVFNTTTTTPNSVNQSDPTVALDLAQQFYLDSHWALRIDLKNHFYQETIYQAGSGATLRTNFTYYGAVMLGATYFFGEGSK